MWARLRSSRVAFSRIALGSRGDVGVIALLSRDLSLDSGAFSTGSLGDVSVIALLSGDPSDSGGIIL